MISKTEDYREKEQDELDLNGIAEAEVDDPKVVCGFVRPPNLTTSARRNLKSLSGNLELAQCARHRTFSHRRLLFMAFSPS